jgi:hypothetical protein
MGSWYLSIALSIFLVLVGLYTHWIVIAVAAVLPFIPMVSIIVERRRARRADNHDTVD